MKKLLISILALAGVLSASAQTDTEGILAKIEKTQNGGKAVSHRFIEERTGHPGKKGNETVKGSLTFKSEGDYLLMDYDNSEQFLIDGSKMTIKRDGPAKVLDLNKNLMMRGLSHTLLYSFKGTLKKLSEEQKIPIEAKVDGANYVVSLTAVKKQPRGYNKVEAVYKKGTCELLSIRLDEFTGASTYYYWE